METNKEVKFEDQDMISKVSILGAGTMGAGIAQWFAQTGVQVELYDVHSEQIFTAKNQIFDSWERLIKRGRFTKEQIKEAKSLITFLHGNDDQGKFDKASDLFLEVVSEDFDLKVSLFQRYDHYFNEETIFASNTSSIPINAMAKELSSQRKERFVGLHFFNPAPIMKLVEIVQGHWSHPDLCQSLVDWFHYFEKMPALCQDAPGFIVNRLARSYYGEALRIVKTEGPLIKETDEILKEVGGFRMGPFELMDLIGIDVNLEVTKSVWKAFSYEPRFAPHPLQEKLVTSGRLGKKTKGGFYDN